MLHFCRRAHLRASIFFISLLVPITTAVDFQSCIREVRNGDWGLVGGTDNHGNPVPDISIATGITYELCLRACGATSEPFNWPTFSRQFTSWLLPWLALVSQLPFGANDKLDNFVSVLLTVGSPTLAAYSLALTALNGRWVARHFAEYNYPNIRYAVQALSSLQQSPLTVTTTGSLLTSLVLLPENDEWWRELVIQLNYTYTWSVSAVTSIAWVVIAYVFSLIDAFTGGNESTVTSSIPPVDSTSEGIGSLWFWLLPIVIGWLQLSPKCDSTRLRHAIGRANKIAYIATASGVPVLASTVSNRYGISLSPPTDERVRSDEHCTAPIYNYSRFFSWTLAVEEVCKVFCVVSHKAQMHRSVDPEVDWETSETSPAPRNRMGTVYQVEEYCLPAGEPVAAPGSPWGHAVWSRLFLASLLALSLQWGTVGSAVISAWFTPTVGLGCRSGSYLLYGALSTISWATLVLSSLLSHYSTTVLPKHTFAWILGRLSIALRRLGKIIAALNTIWILLVCLFQFSNFYSRCYCNSSVIGLRSRAYNSILFDPADTSGMKGAWIGGVLLAAGSVALCVAFVNLFLNPELPGSRPE